MMFAVIFYAALAVVAFVCGTHVRSGGVRVALYCVAGFLALLAVVKALTLWYVWVALLVVGVLYARAVLRRRSTKV